jgi:hypothetical protein
MNSNNSALRCAARPFGVAAATAVALGLLSAGTANADTFIGLPDGHLVGDGVTITRAGEHALVSPSLAANGTGRVVWVSGIVTADVTTVQGEDEPGPWNGADNAPGTNNSSTHGVSRISTGYVVGCQVDLNGLGGSVGMSMDLDGPSMSSSLSVPLAAGEVKFVGVGGKDIKKNGSYSVQYRDTQLEIQNCGGYAQARAYTVVEIVGNYYSKTTLYGQPFSIG